jgi:urease accessory protein
LATIIPTIITMTTKITAIITIARTSTAMPTTITTMATTAEVEGGLPAPLFLWLSPAFPIGAFAYSHGLEWAVEAGDIDDARSLEAWLSDLLDFGAPRADAILFALAHRAVASGDFAALAETNALAVALGFSSERRLETTAQGAAFVAAARAAWDCAPLMQLARQDLVAYPVAVATAAAGHGLPLEASLQAFVLAFVANGVSAVVRLGPIGQTDGQRVLAALLPQVRAVAHQAVNAAVTDLGGCAFRSDIAAMRHETQYSRLFRS